MNISKIKKQDVLNNRTEKCNVKTNSTVTLFLKNFKCIIYDPTDNKIIISFLDLTLI